jgi:hypothetical protein
MINHIIVFAGNQVRSFFSFSFFFFMSPIISALYFMIPFCILASRIFRLIYIYIYIYFSLSLIGMMSEKRVC